MWNSARSEQKSFIFFQAYELLQENGIIKNKKKLKAQSTGDNIDIEIPSRNEMLEPFSGLSGKLLK